MLLRPRPPSTAVDEGEPGADLEGFRHGFSAYTAGLSADVGNGELSSAREWSRRRHDPDGSDAASPLNCCRAGVADYSSSVNCVGISRRGPYSSWSSQRKLPEWMLPRSICSRSPSGISRAALIVVAPEPSLSSSALSKSSSSTASWQAVVMSGGVDDEALVDRQQVLAFDDEFGHWGFSCLMLPTPQPPPTSVSRGQF